MTDGHGPLPDSTGEALFVVAVALLAVLGTMQYVKANPGAPWQLEAAYSTALSVAGGQQVTSETTLHLPQEDAAYLNRVYRELNTQPNDRVGEQGYCLDVVNGRLSVQQAGTLEAREGHVVFTTANCLGVPIGTAHFHPPQSRPVLSGPDTSARGAESNDKRSLLTSEFELSCVQAGVMTETPDERTRAFRCYLKPASGDITDEFPEVPVLIT